MSPMNILAVRFILAFLVLAVIFHKKLFACSKNSLKGGLILGVLYTVCMIFEMYSLRLIDSGVSSLIENMAIVMVPIYAAILTRTLPKKKTMLCALLAVIGVGCLSLTQSSCSGGGLGIVLMILAALTYAACIMATEKVTQDADPVTVGMLQLGVMGSVVGGEGMSFLKLIGYILILLALLLYNLKTNASDGAWRGKRS